MSAAEIRTAAVVHSAAAVLLMCDVRCTMYDVRLTQRSLPSLELEQQQQQQPHSSTLSYQPAAHLAHSSQDMHPLVRDLYKRFLVVSSSSTQHSQAFSASPSCMLLTGMLPRCPLVCSQVVPDYPLPLDECKRRIREGFLRNSELTGQEDILRAVHHGRYKVSQPNNRLKDTRLPAHENRTLRCVERTTDQSAVRLLLCRSPVSRGDRCDSGEEVPAAQATVPVGCRSRQCQQWTAADGSEQRQHSIATSAARHVLWHSGQGRLPVQRQVRHLAPLRCFVRQHHSLADTRRDARHSQQIQRTDDSTASS